MFIPQKYSQKGRFAFIYFLFRFSLIFFYFTANSLGFYFAVHIIMLNYLWLVNDIKMQWKPIENDSEKGSQD